eukprot:TRINITY_DN7390_c0_g1_i6.p1 TRINITY_DN7390_c0_g1~~TRINITY_DN7390_c0_g1_i6.p1  ORF type:complete len:138 (-),score=26.18 TRINITY_DN7390_c0_g1_i6:34-447(-)
MSIQVSIVGSANKGKSFILGQLSGLNLPSGYNLKTEGLSIVFPPSPNVPITFMDTEGLMTGIPLQGVQPENIEKCFLDKKATESLLQSFIITSADIILVVVDILTYSDQMLIEKIIRMNENIPVSYTHLTLPTIYSV